MLPNTQQNSLASNQRFTLTLLNKTYSNFNSEISKVFLPLLNVSYP